MKLGVWNRLAVVAAFLACLILPLWGMVDNAIRSNKAAEAIYNLCMSSAAQFAGPIRTRHESRCVADRFDPLLMYHFTWTEWGEAVLFVFAGCAILYGLTWISAWTVRWVWRGRFVDRNVERGP